jgi:exopolysaccharide biosynthesis polyprenyl glycosylphosphotransferase
MPDRRAGLVSFWTGFAAAAAAALVCWALSDHTAAVTAFVLFWGADALVAALPSWTRLMRLAPIVKVVGAPALGAGVLLIVQTFYGLDAMRASDCAVLFAAASAVMLVAVIVESRRRRPAARVAVVGSQRAADALARELRAARQRRYEVVGVVAVGSLSENGHGEVPRLGTIAELRAVVEDADIDLVVMTGEVPRLDVFGQLSTGSLPCAARVVELSALYEDVFGHVPIAEINASWFQYAMDPGYRPPHHFLKRAVDIVVAGIGLIVALPLLAVLVLLIRRDGGPALFRQVRIGEGGRPFTMLKLRTMVAGTDLGAQWTSFEDPRVTRVGRFLRRANLDELPQFLNILRGDMSVVGPRPEQPEFVERLEQLIPFYQRRHLVKPGLTGWSQVRCGYIRSDRGSAWKLCHDLYYLKHQSALFDAAILLETVLTMIRGPLYDLEPGTARFVEFAQMDERPVVLAG